MRLHMKSRPTAKPTGSLIAALDIGSSKVCCFIGRVTGTGRLNIIGIGHNESRGIKSGKITDMELLEISVGQAVQSAEEMAGVTINEIIVNISGVHANSHTTSAKITVSTGEVTENDVRRALTAARDVETPGQNDLIHAIPVSFGLDGTQGITDPRNMVGRNLSAAIHGVTASNLALQNIQTCVRSNHLEVESFCASPYASALACLVEDEIDLGCTVIDMGAGTTSIAVFMEGALVYVDAIPIGGAHVTNDIARGLTTPINHAERIKTLFGSAIQSTRDEIDMIDVPQIGEDDSLGPNHVPRSLLTGIIQPRLEETFEMVRARLDASGYIDVVGRRVVLTGGAAQLQGAQELGTLILDKQIRIASPVNISGLPDATGGPAFSAAAGLLIYGLDHQDQVPNLAIPIMTPGSMMSRVSQWLKENW